MLPVFFIGTSKRVDQFIQVVLIVQADRGSR